MPESMDLGEIWKTAVELLTESVGGFTLMGLTPKSFENGVCLIVAASDVIKKRIDEARKTDIERCLTELLGEKASVVLEVSDEKPPLTEFSQPQLQMAILQQPAKPRKEVTSELFEVLPLNERNTFGGFAVGDCNKFAHAAAMQIVSNPGKSYNPLFIHGKAGLGKTHIAQAICHELAGKGLRVVYVSGESFVNSLIDAIKMQRTAAFRDFFRHVDVWGVDDVQFVAGKIACEEELHHTFNTLLNNDKQVVMCSDKPPKEALFGHDRIRSRMEMGVLADLRVPSELVRLEILQKKLAFCGSQVDQCVLEHIAHRVASDVRNLEGALKDIDVFQLGGRKITLTEVDELIADRTLGHAALTLGVILARVCQRYPGIMPSDLTGPAKTRDIAVPRHEAIYLVCKLLQYPSLEAIGKEFSNREHSTVMYSRDKVIDEIRAQSQWGKAVAALERELREEYLPQPN